MWPFDKLVSTVQDSFSRASTDYNMVHEAARKLEIENERLGQLSVVSTGLKNMITNRYNGVMNIGDLWDKGREGAYWAYYWGTAPNLKQDVQAATQTWAYSKLTLPNFSLINLAKGASTAMGTTSRDIERLQNASQVRVQTEAKFLAASVASSMAISAALKRSSTLVQNEFGKLFLRGAQRSWQATGMLALAYGLGRLHDAIHETGPFADDLRIRRDNFLQGRRVEIDRRLNEMTDHVDQQLPPRWM